MKFTSLAPGFWAPWAPKASQKCLKSREQGRYFLLFVSQKVKNIYSLSLPQNGFWPQIEPKVSQKAGSKAGHEMTSLNFWDKKCLKSDLHCKFCNFCKIANFANFAKIFCKKLQLFASCIATFAKVAKNLQKIL